MIGGKPMSFIMAMKHFFGFKEGQTLTQFSAELKGLNEADRAYFEAGLTDIGYVISATPGIPASSAPVQAAA